MKVSAAWTAGAIPIHYIYIYISSSRFRREKENFAASWQSLFWFLPGIFCGKVKQNRMVYRLIDKGTMISEEGKQSFVLRVYVNLRLNLNFGKITYVWRRFQHLNFF